MLAEPELDNQLLNTKPRRDLPPKKRYENRILTSIRRNSHRPSKAAILTRIRRESNLPWDEFESVVHDLKSQGLIKISYNGEGESSDDFEVSLTSEGLSKLKALY